MEDTMSNTTPGATAPTRQGIFADLDQLFNCATPHFSYDVYERLSRLADASPLTMRDWFLQRTSNISPLSPFSDGRREVTRPQAELSYKWSCFYNHLYMGEEAEITEPQKVLRRFVRELIEDRLIELNIQPSRIIR